MFILSEGVFGIDSPLTIKTGEKADMISSINSFRKKFDEMSTTRSYFAYTIL